MAARVSIGLPVYNGENYLTEALSSLLAQTYTDFEVVISDNGSTDRTEAICRDFAARDTRVRYVRNEVNRGATWNFNRALALSRGEYFRWSAHDDLIEPDYLAACVAALDENPTAALCQAAVRVVDGDGHTLELFERWPVPMLSTNPHVRFNAMVLHADRCYEIFGLIRRSALDAIPPLGDHGHADGVMLARLGMVGTFIEVPERLQYMRVHDAQSMSVYGCYSGEDVDFAAWAEWYNPNLDGNKQLPHWRMFWEYFRSPVAVRGVRPLARVLCTPSVANWVRLNRRPLVREGLHAARSRTRRRTHAS